MQKQRRKAPVQPGFGSRWPRWSVRSWLRTDCCCHTEGLRSPPFAAGSESREPPEINQVWARNLQRALFPGPPATAIRPGKFTAASFGPFLLCVTVPFPGRVWTDPPGCVWTDPPSIITPYRTTH
ncbi:hypothetical protein SKAU_G00314740 [Synaphobranchus kaupii]|uniref:Uncharacterized protein n=1 Tax=Synaphobranchus kaupii TaxID=118154 RepID=A0A9Q1ESC5_SYNKA|nr:hypothetical protein SKAU_G00314740 [Synaphobranchus kaupii]